MKAELSKAEEDTIAHSTNYEDHWINEAKTLNRITRQNQGAYSLWDLAANRFIFFSDEHNVLGVDDPRSFTGEGGVKCFLSRVHSTSFRAVHLMYQQCLLQCAMHPDTMQDSLFQFDALYQKSKTTNIQLLFQAQVVETDASGYPLLFLNTLSDITYLKKENTANLVITSDGHASLWNYCFDKKMLEPVKGFSIQEKRVLCYLSQKKGSKEIAALLNTSPHTIDTQRRSLLHKTNCIDCTALITYARMTGILS